MQVPDDKISQSFKLIILAAGASTRLGQPKQLLQFEGKTLVRLILEMALQVAPSPVIILGANTSLIENEISDMPVEKVFNPGWEEGLASSIRIALTSLHEKHSDVNNVILIVCDQPYVTASLLKNLISTHQETNSGIVACTYQSTIGIPVLFNKKYFEELRSLEGREGAKKLISKHAEDVATVPFPLGHVDIDTIEDYQLLLQNNNDQQ